MGILDFNRQVFIGRSLVLEKPLSKVLMVGASKDQLTSAKKLDLDHSSYDSIMAVDGGAEWLRRNKIVPNFYVGDFDTVSRSTLRWLERCQVDKNVLDSHKDEIDFYHAIQKVLENSPQGVSIDLVGFLGGKIDHFLGVLGVVKKFLSRKAPLQFTFVGSEQVAFVLSAPQRRSLSLAEMRETPFMKATFSQGTSVKVSLVPLTKCLVSEEGFEWELRDKVLSSLDDLGISNQITNDQATVTCSGGMALLICSRKSI